MGFTVYLAGPMSGLKHAQAHSWRREAKAALGRFGIDVALPYNMVLSQPDKARALYSSALKADMPDAAIMQGDLQAIAGSDAMLVNVALHKGVSVGTMIEIGYALRLGIEIFYVSGPNDPHDNPLTRALRNRFVNLKDACDAVVCEAVKSARKVR